MAATSSRCGWIAEAPLQAPATLLAFVARAAGRSPMPLAAAVKCATAETAGVETPDRGSGRQPFRRPVAHAVPRGRARLD